MMIEFEYPQGATPIDPDEQDGLLLSHITTRGELDRWEQENILEAWDWVERKKPSDILNIQFIKELHDRMFSNVWRWAGSFRKSNKNIGGSWHQITDALRNLCDDVHLRIKLLKDSPDEIAVRFHHRLVSIHPFPNGNGRHARLMTDILLENMFNCERFTWGRENLTKAGNARQRYIAALQAADENDYELLIAFVRT